MGKYFKLVNYPIIPETILSTKLLENDSRTHFGKQHDGSGDQMTYTVDHRAFSAITYHVGYPDNELLVNWVIDNLKKSSSATVSDEKWRRFLKARIKVRYQVGNPEAPSGFRVHADYNSVAALMYFWDTGGDAVKTSWWKWRDPNTPLVSKERSFRENPRNSTNAGHLQYNDLELIESFIAQPNQWYLYCGSVLHDVQNVVGTRKYVSIFFLSFDELVEYGFDTFGLDQETLEGTRH